MSGLCTLDVCVFLFFFFKQKTAYELRISDWSSDVCSSDLAIFVTLPLPSSSGASIPNNRTRFSSAASSVSPSIIRGLSTKMEVGSLCRPCNCLNRLPNAKIVRLGSAIFRSEEHTSELQSLMRTSYVVSCLNKKKRTPTHALQVVTFA